MDARTGADRRLLAAEMENPLTLDHVDDLVVDVAVHAGPTRRDDADELRHVAAAEILVHEEAELAIRARRQGRTIRIPHGDAVTAGTGIQAGAGSGTDAVLLLRRGHGDREQLSRAGVVDPVAVSG